jgi:hypothetical protein
MLPVTGEFARCSPQKVELIAMVFDTCEGIEDAQAGLRTVRKKLGI